MSTLDRSINLSSEEIERCFNALNYCNEIVVDVETSGLDKHRNFICGYVFTVSEKEDETWYLPIRHRDGGNLSGVRRPTNATDYNPQKDVHPLEHRIKAIMANPNKHWIGHNIKYDLWLLHRHGINVSGTVEDTMVNAALIDENVGKYDLSNCAKMMGVQPKYADIYSAISQYVKKYDITITSQTSNLTMPYFWWMPGDGVAATYAKDDGISTYQLCHAQREEIEKQDLKLVWSVEKRVTKTLFRMERRGVPVDEEKLDLVQKKVKELLIEAERKVPSDLNVRSGPQMKKYVRDCGRTDWPLTPKGNPSFPETYLETFQEGRDIIAVRKLRNLESTFLEGSIRGHLFNGRVHCNFNQTAMGDYGTVSGRLSSSDPNMQQIPKRDKILAPLLRQIYRPIPPFKWWSADYKQQEYRVFAEYARSKSVLNAYASDPDTDYHQLVADILHVERDPAAKRINLGTIYNMGVAKLAEGLGVEPYVAAGYMGQMRKMMPEAKQFNKNAENTARARGYVFTKLKRRRRFPNPNFAHKAGNGIIQGSSADITKVKMVEVDEYLESENAESGLILQVHDSLENEFIEDERHHMDTCMEIMQSFGEQDLIQFDVPMRLDIAVGESWGHATFPSYGEWV